MTDDARDVVRCRITSMTRILKVATGLQVLELQH
jgi:hypothetical protein